MHLRRFSRRGLSVLVLGAMLLVTLIGGSMLFSSFIKQAIAAVVPTCSTHPDALHCTRLDPIKERCVTAQTSSLSIPILTLTGQIVGRVDRRFSPSCHTWWARILDYRHHPGPRLFLQVGPQHYTLPFPTLAYSDMVFDAPNAQAPQIIGTLSTAQGTPDPTLSATIAAA